MRKGYLIFFMIIFVFCGCGKKPSTVEETVPTATVAYTPDDLYRKKIEAASKDEAADFSVLENWYGDYAFVEYVRPQHLYQPCFDKTLLLKRTERDQEEIRTISFEQLTYYTKVDKELEPDFYLDYQYQYYISQRFFRMKCTALDNELLLEIDKHYGSEYEAAGKPRDYSIYAMGDDCFSDMEFLVHDFLGSNVLVLFNEHDSSANYAEEYWVEGENGYVFCLNDAMITKWKKVR